MPYLHSEIDKIVKFVNTKYATNQAIVKTSLQQDPLVEKYKLTPEQLAQANNCSAKQDNMPVEKVIRNNILFAPDGMFDAGVKAKIISEDKANKQKTKTNSETKTQEKIEQKQPKKNNSQNSR